MAETIRRRKFDENTKAGKTAKYKIYRCSYVRMVMLAVLMRRLAIIRMMNVIILFLLKKQEGWLPVGIFA